jgi:haloalkane dehalogenase
MEVLRTPDDCFIDLPDFNYQPNYIAIDANVDGILASSLKLRIHYIDEGPRDAEPVLLLHGEPSWSFLYRKVISTLLKKGYRTIAPDLIGFGRSDKPSSKTDYTYARHVGWIKSFIEKLDLTNITLVCQDWGGLIGLRIVAQIPHRFVRVVAANTMLPTGQGKPSQAFLNWRQYSQETKEFNCGNIVSGGCTQKLSDEVIKAYNAPFPDDSYKSGARIFPTLVPVTTDDKGAIDNMEAWKSLSKFDKPFLCAFSDGDPVTRGGDKILRQFIPGAKTVTEHVTIKNAGHFLQEDKGEELGEVVAMFISKYPVRSSKL